MSTLTADDVLGAVDAAVGAAALGAAMELGLFWLLDDGPLSPDAIGAALAIPARRCAAWLRLLERDGYLEPGVPAGTSALSAVARSAILATYSAPTWAFLAQESRERRDALADLPRRLRDGAPTGAGQGYVGLMGEDPDRARRFCRMLWEVHQPLAAGIAGTLDLAGVRRLLDVGGGSGVLAAAVARRHPELQVTVVDIPNVCRAGREIIGENGLAAQVTFEAADLLRDPLPAGFDAAIECDVGVYDEALFTHVRRALVPGGRFVIVDQLAAAAGDPPPHLSWVLAGTLREPDFSVPTVTGVRALLHSAGFADVASEPLSVTRGPEGRPRDGRPQEAAPAESELTERFVVIEARAPVASTS